MNFIKKAIDKRADNSVHLQFQKFSKGEFSDRAVINAKRSGDKYTINTTAEFANDLVRVAAKKLDGNRAKIQGAIISTADLKKEIEFKEIKQFQGVKKYVIESEMNGEEILNLMNKFPAAFFALSFDAPKDETSLKIKAKAPKSGKPANKSDESPKADFCKLITKDKELAGSFVFENPFFKKAEITHKFLIDKIVIPEELKNEKDFAKIRELSKRAGKILRKGIIDGKPFENAFDFEA